jgi:rhomboid family GlyGly-CTERM serine protease
MSSLAKSLVTSPVQSVSRPVSSIGRVWQFVRRIPLTLAIAACAVGLAALPGALGWLQFDSQDGSLWTLLTSHLVHYNVEHLVWDLAVFVGVGAALERKSASLYIMTLLTSALLIPPLAVAWESSVTSYCGLSGIDTALFAAFATGQLIDGVRARNMSEVLLFSGLLLAMVGKSWLELVCGSTLFVTSSAFQPLPVAHLAGAGLGLALAGIRGLRRRQGNS